MTIDEAIKHADERANADGCFPGCRAEHAQLAKWLRELKELREAMAIRDDAKWKALYENAKLRDLVREMSFPYKYGDFDCGLCPHTDKCWDSETLDFSPDGCVILQMVRELGIGC